MDNLGYGQINTFDMSVNSVMLDLIYDYYYNNASLEAFIQNDYLIVKAIENDDNILVIDSETGIIRDINTTNNYYGAYCFHDQITELAVDFSNFFLSHQATIWRDFFGALGVMGSYYGLYSSIPAIDAVITAGSGLTLSLGFSFFGASIGFGLLLVDMRTNYVPIDYWKYFSFHRTWLWGYEQRSYIGSDNCIHYIEIPKNSDGTLNWNEAIYY